MKKINGLVLSALTAAFLVGCGGGGGSSSSTTTATDVTVERGPLWGAKVTDATGKAAKQKVADSNVYTFDSAPTYPIKAVGGIIDIDGDSSTTDDIFDFTGKELISYTNVITPVTNYLGDITSEAGKAKLAKLESLGLTKDDLVNTVASKSTTKKAEMISLTNALFELMNDSVTNNDDLTNETNYNSFKNRFDTFVNMVKDDVAINAKASSQALEETVLKGILNNYTEAEGKSKIDELKATLFTLTSDMLSGKIYKLIDSTDNSYVVFKLNADGTSSETGYYSNGTVEYTAVSTWTIANGKLQITLNEDKSVDTYTFTETPANDVEVTVKTSDEPEFVVTMSGFTNITLDSSSSSTLTLTNEMFSGKEIYIESNGGVDKEYLDLKADGTISYRWSFSDGDSGSCDGKWNVSTNKLNTLTTNCTDGDNSEGTIIFKETPKDGASVTFVYGDTSKEDGNITTISDITAK